MKAEELKAIQAPLKEQYAAAPESAVANLHASGEVNIQNLTCRVVTPNAEDRATSSGLHPFAGGDGLAACSGDMLLQSLVACSGVTFAAVATAMNLEISAATIEAKGLMDFRGTLGVDRTVAVGLTDIELSFEVHSEEPADKIEKLIQLTERYCVVLQTLTQGVKVSSNRTT